MPGIYTKVTEASPKILESLMTAWNIECVRSYGYVETSKPGFMLPSWVDLGADELVASGGLGADVAAALKADARRRVASGSITGYIAYVRSGGSQAHMRGSDEDGNSKWPISR